MARLLGRNFTGLVESKAWKYTVGLKAAYQRENVPCKVRAEQSISCLWQMWCAWSEPLIKYWQPAWGSSVKWRRACRAPSKWHLGEKKGGKNNERNVYGTGTILLMFTLNFWKFILICIEAGAGGGIKSAFHVVLSSLIFFPRHLTTTQFRNLSEPSCLLLKQSKCALTLPAKQQQPPQSCTKFREFCTSGFANVCDVCPDVYLEKVEAYSACLCIVVADFNFGTVQ